MGKPRIRKGTLTHGGAVSNVANVRWQDSHEFDRTPADEEMHGGPVQMNEGGSGSFELLGGNIATGYATSDLVFAYHEIVVTAGVEADVVKTITFSDVTFRSGGEVPSEGRGRRTIDFDYGAVSDIT